MGSSISYIFDTSINYITNIDTKLKKTVFTGYFTFSIVQFIIRTWKQGKVALDKHNEKIKTGGVETKTVSQVVTDACSENLFYNMADSFLFPYHFLKGIIPAVILFIYEKK